MNVGDLVELRSPGHSLRRGFVSSVGGGKVRVKDGIGNEEEWDASSAVPVSPYARYTVPKCDVGDGDVYRCVTPDHLRIFGLSVSLKGSFAVMEKVAMRIVHAVDGHGGYPSGSDSECVRCRMIRAFRKNHWAAALVSQEGMDDASSP